ncbi:PBECR4 domain-containing protein [uncultured Enterococcus sp.]|uniref:PBECR4 domain-containing protein n=1 Tax=uncultured Enterococcus sp. TaxID=167972 RepID=UPI00261BC72E|nr:PBECR4 domain-containing protein [uncultured Enterococcus sp.]
MSNQPPNSRKNDYKQRLKVAKNRNILDVAQALGMNLEKRGGTYVWSEHDSLVIFPKKNNFKWFSQDVQGDPITLVEQVKNVEFKEALNFLNDPSLTSFDATKVKSENKPFRYFLKEHSNPRLAKDFLVNVRGLHPKIVDFFMDKGVIVQSSRYHKADQNSEPVVIFKSFNPQTKDLIGATLQGINENWEKYPKKGRLKEILANSSGDFGVHVDIGTPKKLIFFESAIDMMSYYELKRPKINDARLVAMNGLNQRVISNHLKDILAPTSPIKGEDYLEDFHSKLSPQSKQHLKQRLGLELIIAVDNDEKGKQFIRKLGKYKNLPFRSDVPQAIFDEEKMDWNEYLSLQNQLKNGYRFPTQNEQQIVQGYIPELQKVAEYYQTNLSNQNLHFVSAGNEYHVLPTTFNARHFSHLVGVYFLEKEGENVVTLDSEKLLKDIIDNTINYKQIAVTKNFENTKKKLAVLNKFPDLFDVKTLYLQDFSKIQQSQNNHAVYNDALRTKDKELLLGFKDLTNKIGFMVPYTLQNTSKPRFERKLQNVGNTEPVVAIFAEENTSNGKQLNIISVDNDYFQSPEQLESLRNQMLNRILGTPSVQNHIDNTQQAYFSLEPSPISNMEPEIEAEFQEIENNQRNEVQQPMNEDFLNDPRFNEEQKEVLLQGVDRGVDISIYADPTFNSWQMKEILAGLENKLDVDIYANPEFNDAQMEQIREGLEQKLDVSIYAKPEFDELQMAEIKYGLSRDIDVSIYADPKFGHYQMEEIAEGLIQNQNVSIYAKPKFHNWQMKEIRLGLLHGVDVTVYADPRFNDEQMEQIREGLENHLAVDVYADPQFDANQMEQIRKGLEEKLDVSIYAKPEFNWKQMDQIREGLEQGIDVRSYADPNISADEMEARRNQAFKELEAEMNRSNTHWIVEKNEGLAGYQGKLLTQDLLDEIKAHDAKMFEDGELDYYKFYFDKVQDDQTLEHIRVDVGDGLEVNRKIYEYLENEIASYDRVIYESVEQAQEVIKAMQELPLEFRNKLSNVGEILSPYDIQYNNGQFQLIDNENNVVVQEGHPKRFLTRSLEAEHLVRLENGVDSYPHYDFSSVTSEFGIDEAVTQETLRATTQLLQEEFPELFNEEVSSTVHPYDQVAEALRKLPIYDKQNENLTLEDFLKLDTDYEILSYHEARHRAENIFIPDSLKTDNYYLYNAETGDIEASAKTPTVFLDYVMDLDEWRVYSSDYSEITDSFGLDVEATKRAYETALQAVELQYRPIEENYTQVQTALLNNLHNFVNNSTDNSIDYGYQQRLHQEEVLTALKQLPVWDDNEMHTLNEALSGSDLEMYTVVKALNDSRINISQAEWEKHFAEVPSNTTIEDNALLLLDMNNYPEVEILVAQRETEKFVDELTELDYFVDYDTELDFTRKFDFSEVDNRFGLEKNATRNAFNQAMMGEFLTTKQEEMLQSLTYSLDDNIPKDIDLLHTFQLEKDWQQLSSEEKMMAIDTLNRKDLTFDEQHRMDQILELGAKDTDYMVRSEVADTGNYLDYFITDPNDQVRGIVAAHGVALDYLINDPEDFVRYSIAMQGYGLDKALQYIKENGVEAGDETPIAIMEYGFALEDFSKDIHYRQRAIALGAGVYGESIREDILLDDDPKIRNMALKARDTLLYASKESKLEAIEEMHIAPPYSYPYGALLYDKDPEVLIALAKHNYGLDVLRHHENPEVAKIAQERADKLHMFVLEENNLTVEKELTVAEKIRDIEETYLEKSSMPQEEINKMVAEYIHDESIEVRKALAVHGFGLQELVHDENSSIRYLALRSMAMAPSDDISELTFKKIYHQDPDPIVYDNNLTCYDAEVPMINGYYVCYTIFTDKDLGYAITLDDLNQVKNTFQTELYKRNDNQVVRLNAGVDFSFIAESDSLLKVPALEQLDRVIIQGDDSQELLTPKNKLVDKLKDVWNAHFEQQRKQAQTHPSDEKQEAFDKLTVEQGINNIVQKAFDPENLKAENIHSYALNSIKEMTEKPSDFEQFLDSASKHPELSLQNIALIEQQWENAKEVKTFRDWQNTKEGIDVEDVIVSTRTFINRATGESKTVVLDSVSVKAGEKAQITLYEPVMKTMIPVIDPNGNQMVNEQGKTMYKSFDQATSKEKAMVATGELKSVSIQAVDNQGQPIYQTYKAFELSQTNLKPESYDKVVKQAKETYQGQERNIVEGLKDVAKEMGMTIAIDTTNQLKENEHYQVDNEKKMILVSKNDAIERQMQSAVSALAQVALDNGNNKRPTEFSKVEKDLADQLITRHLGLQADKPSDSLTNTIRQMDNKELTISLRRAQVVSKKVIQGVRDRIQQASQKAVAKNMNVSPMLGQNKGRSI